VIEQFRIAGDKTRFENVNLGDQNRYKHKFSESRSKTQRDLDVISFVPVQVILAMAKSTTPEAISYQMLSVNLAQVSLQRRNTRAMRKGIQNIESAN
jgi:hypothetical protein